MATRTIRHSCGCEVEHEIPARLKGEAAIGRHAAKLAVARCDACNRALVARLTAEADAVQAGCDRANAEREAGREAYYRDSPRVYRHRGYRNTYRCTCSHCDGEIGSLEGYDCDWSQGPRDGRGATLCPACMTALGVEVVGRRPRPVMQDDGALDALAADADSAHRRALRADD